MTRQTSRLCFLCQTLFNSLGICLIARLVKQGKHVLLVGLYTRLVEWVNTQYVTADATANLKEVDELADVASGWILP